MIKGKCENENCTLGEKNSCGLCCTKIENVNVQFGNTQVLKDVNLHIHCGELTAIIGPNGAGKSTLLKAILGEIRHTGKLKFLSSQGETADKPIIGYVPQNIEYDKTMPMSVLDFYSLCITDRPVWLSHPKKQIEKIREFLRRVNAEYIIKRKIGDLSGGEIQRLLLSVAITPIPHILLLDEPVSGIDHSGLQMFYELVSELRKEFDMTIILVSHDLDLVRKYADRVIFLNKTIECQGTPEVVFKNEKVLETFGLKL